MKAKIITLMVGLLSFFPAMAQYNPSVFFSDHLGSVAGRMQPYKIGKGMNHFEYGLFIDTRLHNSALTFGDLQPFFDSDKEVDRATVDNIIAANRNDINFGLSAIPAIFSFKIGKDGEEFLSMAISTGVHAGTTFGYSNRIAKVILEGNRQYANQNVNISRFNLNSILYNDFTVGAAFRAIDLSGIKIRPGVNFKYLVGHAAAQTDAFSLSMFTEQNGRYIDFRGRYEVNTAYPDIDGTDDLLPLLLERYVGNGAEGRGFGLDLGVEVEITDRINAGISVANIGGINFNQNTTNYLGRSDYRFRGFDMDIVSVAENRTIEIDSDSLLQILNPEETNEDFSYRLPTTIILQGSIGLGRSIDGKKGNTRYRHNAHLLYMQGFRNSAFNSSTPFVSLGYGLNLGQTFNFTTNVGFGGYKPVSLGTYIGMSPSIFKFGFGTNMLLSYVNIEDAYGADVFVNFGIVF